MAILVHWSLVFFIVIKSKKYRIVPRVNDRILTDCHQTKSVAEIDKHPLQYDLIDCLRQQYG